MLSSVPPTTYQCRTSVTSYDCVITISNCSYVVKKTMMSVNDGAESGARLEESNHVGCIMNVWI